ncbi:MAG: mannose-1-phosphate guanylyltransferase/mannose-6-phosphate isomerase [Pseudomonadota bacterium]
MDAGLVTPVIMSGGSGTRMWPLSRKAHPKQFHKLFSELSLFQETLKRVSTGNGPFNDPIILASALHRHLIENDLNELGVLPELIILEPMARNTAPAVAALSVAAERRRPGGVVVVLPADHLIPDHQAFSAALESGRQAAADGAIVTFGLKPKHPETGYGYIQSGDGLGGAARRVAAFKEKPDLETAKKYVASGDYHWNAGIFMFRSDVMLEELREHAGETLDAASRAVEAGAQDGPALSLDANAFEAAPDNSIDYAVMEVTRRAAVVPIDIDWSDIGSWAATWEIAEKDMSGNAARGDAAIFIDAQNTLAVSQGQKIAAVGVRDLLIIATDDGVLVLPRERAQEVKSVVNALKASGETDLL